MYLKKLLFIFSFIICFPPVAQAYPWMFFREGKPLEILELDTHLSYFAKNKATVFSSAKANYHRPELDINVGWTYSFLEKIHYFRLSELAVVFPLISKKWTFSLGFKDVLWSTADRYWNYGLWQPRYLLDAFRPVQMGLPGLHINYKGDTSVSLLLSYFYLPDIIIYPQLKDKKISSKNPFFVGSFGKFEWDINEKDLFRLTKFFEPVAAFQIKHSIKKSHVAFSYAYKPVNQLNYSILMQGTNLSDSSDQLTVKDFNYSVLSHHLTGLEGEIALAENLSVFASLFYEKPQNQPTPGDWVSDEFESHTTLSLIAYFQENWGEDLKTLFTLGWTKTIENRSQKAKSNIWTEDVERLFGRSFNWKEAISGSVEYQNKNWLEGFLMRFRANYALDNGFYALAWENYFYLTKHIRMYLSGDGIFRSSKEKSPVGSSSIEDYKGLSRLLVGAQYVF